MAPAAPTVSFLFLCLCLLRSGDRRASGPVSKNTFSDLTSGGGGAFNKVLEAASFYGREAFGGLASARSLAGRPRGLECVCVFFFFLSRRESSRGPARGDEQ